VPVVVIRQQARAHEVRARLGAGLLANHHHEVRARFK